MQWLERVREIVFHEDLTREEVEQRLLECMRRLEGSSRGMEGWKEYGNSDSKEEGDNG